MSTDGEVITIDGMRYARSLFRHLADEAKIGTLFRLASNTDGITCGGIVSALAGLPGNGTMSVMPSNIERGPRWD